MGLREDVSHCKHCYLYQNGRIEPYIGEYAKNIILFDHYKPDMVEPMEKFWKLFKEVGLSKQEFIVLHTVQCHTKTTKRRGKPYTPAPSRAHREECRPWLHAFLTELEDPKMLVMGNIAMEHTVGEFSGIKELNATVAKPKICGIIVPCVLSVSPSYLQREGEGREMIKKSLEIFKYL